MEERKKGDGENAQFRSYTYISQIVAGEEIPDKEWLSNFFKKFRVEGDRKHFTCLKTTSYKGETLSPHCCGGLFSPITLPVSHLAEKCQ